MKKEYIMPAITATAIQLEEMIAMSFTDTFADPTGDVLVKEGDFGLEDLTQDFGNETWGGVNEW